MHISIYSFQQDLLLQVFYIFKSQNQAAFKLLKPTHMSDTDQNKILTWNLMR